MSHHNNKLNTSAKILTMAECLDLSQNSTEFLEKFDEQTEKAFDQIAAKAILYPLATFASWAKFITTSRDYYKRHIKLEQKNPETLTKQLENPNIPSSDKFYWQMLAQNKTIAKKIKILKIINKYIQKTNINNKHQNLISNLKIFEQELIQQQKEQQELWNEKKSEIVISLVKAVTLTLTTACKLGATLAISAALPWILTAISIKEMGNSMFETYKISKQYNNNYKQLQKLQNQLKNHLENKSEHKIDLRNNSNLKQKINNLTKKCKHLKSERRKSILESATGAIVVTASIAFLANPISAVATAAISMTAFASVAVLSLFKGGCLMKALKSYFKTNIKQSINQSIKSPDIKPNNKNISNNKLEENMSHTDLLFGATKKTNITKDNIDTDGEDEG